MKARTLIILGVVAVLALMVVPALALSPLAATSSGPAVSALRWVPPAKPAVSSNPVETARPQDPEGIDRLIAATEGAVQVSVSRATGAVRFISVSPAQPGALSAQLGAAKSAMAQADAFWAQYGSLFGIQNPAQQLKYVGSKTDSLGATRLEYRQVHEGVPVFAGILFLHFNSRDQLTAVNGVSVPDITVASTPRLTAEQAGQIAVNAVGPTGIHAAKTTLYIYRTGLAQGVRGISHLAYEVEATNSVNVREFVIVDALSGKIVDRWSAIENALIREIYSGTYTTTALVWQEGDPFPYTGVFSEDINNLIYGSGETYNLFSSAFGRDSYDAAGAIMRTVNNDPRINCPNANWNGITTNYCNGVTGDDTVAHEWGHAYTEYTHNLIYAWQPGALNESYSDIWGEVVDLLNGRGTDTPGGLRTDGLCSVFTSPAPVLQINSPITIAGNYPAAASNFGPPLITPTNWITNTVVLVNDGEGRDGSILPPVDGDDATTTDGCTPFVNAAAVAGKIALIDRGTCSFQIKADNANAAGAAGFIVANHQLGGNGLVNMAGTGGTAVGIFVGYNTGLTIRSQLTNTVNATLKSTAGVADNSYRWLSGEDDPAFGGSIRDMWAPNCYNDPARVSDAYYQCDTTDGGGVHTNSGVPNHAFALLVDGGTFNGQTITGIGLTKAAHLYWRAQDVYQTQTTDFADHADALTASCNDLVTAGADLPALSTSISTTVLSGQVFTTTDCLEVTKVISATELRSDPTAQCSFQPLLDPNTPALCASGTGSAVTVFTDTFEIASGWAVSHTDVFSATNLDWVRVGSLPDARPGQAFFATDDTSIGQCTGGAGDASRVMYLTSPAIVLPLSTTIARLAFDHWVATEVDWDGGNLQISVNNGPWQNVAPADFTFNPYNGTLETVANGNTNPLAGLPAFTGSDGGEVTGSWGRSLVRIGNYASSGDTINLRYRLGADGCNGLFGWYVDDVEVYYCSADNDAQITVTPNHLTSVQPENTVVTQTLTISNTGTGNLDWEAAEAQNLYVAARDATDVTLPQGGSRDIPSFASTLKAAPVLLPAPGAVNALTSFMEGFDSVAGLPAAGWALINNSNPLGTTGWFQGNPTVFTAHAGISNTYAGANYNNTGSVGTISNWLLTPEIKLSNGSQLVFYTRIPSTTVEYPDRLEVRLSTAGASTNVGTSESSVGDFTTVLLEINPTLTTGVYPRAWTAFTATVSGLGTPTTGRIGFRYYVTNAGALGDNSNYIGIDTVSYTYVLCAGASDIPWLSVSPMTGTTASQSASLLSVAFNSTGLAGGTYTGKVCIASNDLTDPLVNVPVTLTVQGYSVSLTPATAAQSGDPGQTVTYTLQLTNTGDLSDTFDLAYTGNLWNVQLPVTQTTLSAGAATTIEVLVTVPAGAQAGDSDDVVVTATSQGDPTKSASSTLTTTANAGYGLALFPATAAQTQYVGHVVTYTLQLTNTSNTTATFAISNTGNLWVVGLPASPVQLAAGASMQLNVTVSVPLTATHGSMDTVTLTVTSLADPTKTAVAVLTTTAKRYLVNLPLIMR